MTASWWRLTVRCQPADTETIGALLVSATGQGVEEYGAGELRSIAATEVDAAEILSGIVSQFPTAHGDISQIDPVDWSVRWRDGISSHRFGRLVLSASWLPVTLAANDVLVTIDPQSAFGSGEHGSTRVALRLLEEQLRPGDRVLDFGSGSGVLAIAAATLGAKSAIGIEVDDEAMPIAEANAAQNAVGDRVGFLLGDAEELGPLAGPAELICSNILRSINTLLLPAIRASLTADGIAIFAGMETSEAELFRPVLQRHEWEIVAETTDNGWWGVAARPR